MGRLNPSRETKFSGTHGDRGMFVFPVQLTTSRIGNLTRLIHTLLYVMTIHTYIHTRGHSATCGLLVGILQWKVSEFRFGGLISASYKDSARKFSQITSLRSI